MIYYNLTYINLDASSSRWIDYQLFIPYSLPTSHILDRWKNSTFHTSYENKIVNYCRNYITLYA